MLYQLKEMRTLEYTHLKEGVLVRFCIGLEAVDDLITDIQQALQVLR